METTFFIRAVLSDCLQGVHDLHPLAASALHEFITGDLMYAAFARYFTLPHSDTIDAAVCLGQALAPQV